MRILSFINDELKQFSNQDNIRSIPSVVDGFKEAQRKALYGMLKFGKEEDKVSRIGSKCASYSSYHHGEVSLCDTIVGMAQNFNGSNNINLFEPNGQFGTILSSESSAHRYISTKLSSNYEKLFSKDDDLILKNMEDDGEKIEPEYYYPILPLWMINGSLGVGTGHASKIFNRDTRDVAKLIDKIVKQQTITEEEKVPVPKFGTWKGKVVQIEPGKYEFYGIIEQVNTTTLKVTELPITYDLDKFKAILIKLMDKNIVKDYDNNSTEEKFEFIINVPREIGKKPIDELINTFKLVSRATENVTLWDRNFNMMKYPSVFEALEEFVSVRLDAYAERKKLKLEKIKHDLLYAKEKQKFITYWNDSLTDAKNKSQIELKKEFIDVASVYPEFVDDFLSLRVLSLSRTKIDELEKEIIALEKEYTQLEKLSEKDLYLKELKVFK